MPTLPVRVPLPPGTTAHHLMTRACPRAAPTMPSSGAGIVHANNQRDYPQLDGPGGFAHLETPERFVRAYVLRTLAQWRLLPARISSRT